MFLRLFLSVFKCFFVIVCRFLVFFDIVFGFLVFFDVFFKVFSAL